MSNVKSGRPVPAVDLGLLAVVDVLGEPGEAQHVLGHPLAPLAPGLRVGQRLARARPCVIDSVAVISAWARSDSSTCPKRWALAVPSSLTSAPRRCSSVRTSPRTSSSRVSMTSFFAARSACTPLAADPSCSRFEHRHLLQRGLHGGVALGRRLEPHRGHGVLDRRVHVVGHRRRGGRRTAQRPRHQPGDGRRHRGGEEHGQDDHEGHDA